MEDVSLNTGLKALSNPALTYHTLPMGPKKILLRIENLEDKIDGRQANTYYVNVNDVATELFHLANPEIKEWAVKFKVTEMSIGGAQTLSEL